MNVFADTWRGLVRRRLWPLAVVLVAALAATPFLLAKKPAAVAAPVVAAAPKAAVDPGASFVTLADEPTATTATRRRVLGGEKDPFTPAPVPKVKHKQATASASPTATPAPPAGSTPPSSAAPTGTPPATTPPAPTHPKFSIQVRFGKTDSDLVTSVLERLEPLPSKESPVLVYEGVENGGKVAIFSIPGTVTAQGDGKCSPSPANCETLKLSAGDTEFITVTDTGDPLIDAQFQLDLVKIYRTKTADTGADATAAASSAQQQRKRLKGYRFDVETGTLKRVKQTTRRATL